MRVLFFLSDLDGGGAQRTIVNLLNSLLYNDAVDAVLAVARADGPAANWLLSEINVRPLGARKLRHSLFALRRTIRRFQPDIILSTMADANVIATIAAFGLSKRPKIILRETNSHRARGDIGMIRRTLIGWAYRRADAVIALSRGVRSELVEDYSLPLDHVHVIHNPIDLSQFNHPSHGANSLSLSFSNEGPLVLGIGRLCAQKGFDILIQAFKLLSHPTAKLALLGEGPDRQKLEQLTSQARLTDRIILPGYENDIKPWLAVADVFVLSSRWEGFGHVIVEAMASGLPVIATDCPHGPRDIITPAHDGMLVPPEDPEALASAIDSLLGDPALAERLASNGLGNCSRFSTQTVAEQYVTLFKQNI